jgi:hypothetical protein
MRAHLHFLSLVLVGSLGVPTLAQTRVPATPWTAAQAQAILDRTSRTLLAPDLSQLTPGERRAVSRLLEVGRIFQDVYEEQRHRSALTVRAALEKATDPASRTLLTFLDRRVLRFDRSASTLSIDYATYHDAVRDLLKEVLALQDSGDKAKATAFIDRWGMWDETLHGKVAAAIRAQQRTRFRLFEYAALK